MGSSSAVDALCRPFTTEQLQLRCQVVDKVTIFKTDDVETTLVETYPFFYGTDAVIHQREIAG